MTSRILPPWVAIPFGLACLGVAGYLYWLASTKTTRRQRGVPLGFAITLTILGLLAPLLSFDVVHRIAKIVRRTPSMPRNGVAPPTVLFTSS